ncbi:MAG: pirin family protein [Spirochaetales bacterium]|nr:pirin family protein [Spirochaetales bacterium]
MKYRDVRRVVTGRPAVDGAGVRLVRVIGARDVEEFDPFLMLDAFDSTDPDDYVKGFPWHPHRGIETVTFLASGLIEHGDSLGNKGSIVAGGCQWMTAGSGIIHQEMPKAAPRMLGLQLWLNMPAADKMKAPAYHDLVAERVPAVRGTGWTVRVIGGEFAGTRGAMRGGFVDATMLDIALEPGAVLEIPARPGDTCFAYLMEGQVSVDQGEPLESRRALLFEDGDAVRLMGHGTALARCVLFSGTPLREPIAWGGPIVMNTREELERAFAEIDEGTFIKRI